jgi:potassium-transporting ATPase KdpC subunit
MREIITGAIRFSLVSWILCGFLYPLSSNLIVQRLFPFQANGSLVRSEDGTVVGSILIGENWMGAQWFHGRPSATIETYPSDREKIVALPYNASNSGASNLGPTSEELWKRLSRDRQALDLAQPQLSSRKLPADMLTTSASGLDPDISVENAMLQAPRVAAARGISVSSMRELITKHVIGRDFGIFGEPRVNVLELNLVLERRSN